MSEMQATARVLIVDDTITTLETLADLLREHGYDVYQASEATAAFEVIAAHPEGIDFVLLDRVLDGSREGGPEVARRLARDFPDVFIVMYTAEAKIEDRRRWEILTSGAHRYIRKASVDELLADVDEFVSDMSDLRQLTLEIREIANARRAMFSVLVGLDVRLAIIDQEFRVWYSNRDSERVSRGPDIAGVGQRCWTFFHGSEPLAGPCVQCIVKATIESGREGRRLLLAEGESGRLEWFLHQTLPIKASGTGRERVIAVRETTQRIDDDRVTASESEKIDAIAASIVHLGFGRSRIYRALTPGRIKCIGVATGYPREEDEAYRRRALGFDSDESKNSFIGRALKERRGTLVESVAAEQPLDPASSMNIDQQAPWIDLPVWDEEELVGWLSVDTVGARTRTLAPADIERLRPYAEAVRRVLRGPDESDRVSAAAKRMFAEVETSLGMATDFNDAARRIVTAIRGLVGSVRACRDVRIRIRERGVLRLIIRTNPEGRVTPEEIQESDSRSSTAYVVNFKSDLFMANRREFERDAARKGFPSGLATPGDEAIAIVRAVVEGETVGTLHVECEGELDWAAEGLVKPLLRMAEVTGRLLRDMLQYQRLEEAKLLAEQQLAQAFGAIHGVKGPVQIGRYNLEAMKIWYERGELTIEKAMQVGEKVGLSLLRIERLAIRLLRLVETRKGVDGDQVGLVDLCASLGAAVNEQEAIDGEVTVVRKWESRNCITVKFDVVDFAAIVEELFLNAKRARARVVTVGVVEECDHVVLSVEDDGCGLAGEEEYQLIFDRWYHNFASGAGLGLAFVRHAAEESGGAAWAEKGKDGLRVCVRMRKVEGVNPVSIDIKSRAKLRGEAKRERRKRMPAKG
jgi:CheY-like chemotaxis protein